MSRAYVFLLGRRILVNESRVKANKAYAKRACTSRIFSHVHYTRSLSGLILVIGTAYCRCISLTVEYSIRFSITTITHDFVPKRKLSLNFQKIVHTVLQACNLLFTAY